MKLTRCNQGHFYDADKYETCPHCQGSSGAMDSDDGQKTVASASVANNSTQSIQGQATVPVTPPSQQAEKKAPSSLRGAVDDVQKTVGIFNIKQGQGNVSKEPVAGWLVCVDGPHLGEDFRIRVGRNFIGRMNTMDIVLSNDNSVSREKHSIIIYEPKENMFVVTAGDSKELSYLNDKVVLSPTQLNPYDTLKVGQCSLLFVPLCSDSFSWDLLKNDEEDK